MQLTPEQKKLGKENFFDAVGTARNGDKNYEAAKKAAMEANVHENVDQSRRSFLKASAAVVPGLGAAYFGYQKLAEKDKVRVGFIGTGKEGGVLLTQHPADYMDIVAIADIRPLNRRNAFLGEGNEHRVGLNNKLGSDAQKKIKAYSTYQEMLMNEELDAVVIAVPLSHHYAIAANCLKAGKHVLTEKLMCKTVDQCKKLIKLAKDENKLLAVGHQRHYSALYDNCNFLVKQGVLGNIKFIRAQWHRNTSFDGRDSWRPPIHKMDLQSKELRKLITQEKYEQLFDDFGYEKRFKAASEARGEKYNRDEALVEFLCRWRLYNVTGGGLMAELGSHQLDACSIFLGKKRPIAVQGYGGRNYFGVPGVGTKKQQTDEREADDHVYVTVEFPGENYQKEKDDKVIVTYSSINTNGLQPYGETVFGSRGTMMVHNEQESLLFKENGPGSYGPGGVEQRLALVQGKDSGAVMSASESLAPSTQAAIAQGAVGGKISRGYTEEMEHFCWIIREFKDYYPGGKEIPIKDGGLRCNGTVAMADAIMALTSNLAMDAQRRIAFKDEWFDPDNDATPEEDEQIKKWIKEAKNT